MEILDDIFAGWSFELYDEVNKNDFIRLLTILDETHLLKVNKVSLSNKEIAVSSLEQIFDVFLQSKNNKQDLLLEGFTVLENLEKKESHEYETRNVKKAREKVLKHK